MSDAVSPPRILIASTLKTVYDTRAWEKFGLSLRETNKYEINIIGFSTKKFEISNNVKFYSSGVNSASPLSRFKSQLIFRQVVQEFKPQIVICCTFEYLKIACKIKSNFGYKVIYDVQENYQLNLSLRTDLSKWKRSLFEKTIQRLEATSGIDQYILAEKCYQNQMPEKQPALVLENKFVGEIRTILPKKLESKHGYHFVISGTIAESFGALKAIDFFQQISLEYPFSKLTIIGQVTLTSFQKILGKRVANDPKIDLKTDRIPISHSDIIQAIRVADFLLCPYANHPAFEGKIPSKFFEAQALGVPVLYTENEHWNNFYQESKAGFAIDFSSDQNYLEQFQEASKETYFLNPDQLEVNWESDKQKFLSLIESLI